MRLAVVGAAGRTGALLVEQAATAGHEVTAVARSASRVPRGDRVTVVAGDAADPGIAERAVAGQDAVICTVAAPGRGPSTVVSDVASSLVAAMGSAGCRRLVLTSSRNLVATRPRLLVAPVRWWLREVYADLHRAEEVLRRSGLDWTLARATRLVDADPRGTVWTDQADDPTGGDWRLPRADYARALLGIVEDGAFIREAVGINGATAAAGLPHDREPDEG